MTKIEIPDNFRKNATAYYKRKAREKFRRRSAIEAINSHVKHSFRMARNYLKRTDGDTMNLLLAAAADNLNKWMRATAQQIFALIFAFINCFKFSGLGGCGASEPQIAIFKGQLSSMFFHNPKFKKLYCKNEE